MPDHRRGASPPAPSLQRRLLHPRDFAEALEFVPDWQGLGADLTSSLPGLWRQLLLHPTFNADVIEDVAAPPGRRLQGVGMSVALGADWLEGLADARPARLTRQFYADLLDGRTRLPSEREVARANASTGESEGLTFMVLHYSQRNPDMSDPQAVAVLSAGLTAMRLAHAGHRVREIVQEAWKSECDYMRSIGLVQRTARNGSSGSTEAAADPQPELFSLRRDEALRQLPGFHLREIFEHKPPIFHFRGAEQRLLRRAMFDESDDEIAALLEISPHTLKKLWRSIYMRVADRLPMLLDAVPPGSVAPGAEAVRGPEKRRTLMSYLRQHPEELRPHASSRA